MAQANHSVHVIKSRRLVTQAGVFDGFVAYSTDDGKIHQLALTASEQLKTTLTAETTRDVGDAVVMPGLVDSHVHVNDPGHTDWEDFPHATRAAVRGGTTTIGDMPLNCLPVTTTPEAVQQKLTATNGRIHCDVGFIGGLVPSNAHDIAPLVESGCLAVKCFMIHSGLDEFPHVSQDDLDAALPQLAKLDIPLLVHAELDLPIDAAGDALPADSKEYATFLASRPRQWEDAAISSVAEAALRHEGSRVHIVHLSSSNALPFIQKFRKEHPGVLTVETCPHYLVFDAESIEAEQTQYKCCPPIREGENQRQLWEALDARDIDFVVSDHSPSDPSLKLPCGCGDFLKAWGGIAGVQFRLQATWTRGQARGLDLPTLVRWLAAEPAKFLGIPDVKGGLEEGMDADIVIWDPEAKSTIEQGQVEHLHKATPYLGMEVLGHVQETILRGQVVYSAAEESQEVVFAAPRGHVILQRSPKQT